MTKSLSGTMTREEMEIWLNYKSGRKHVRKYERGEMEIWLKSETLTDINTAKGASTDRVNQVCFSSISARKICWLCKILSQQMSYHTCNYRSKVFWREGSSLLFTASCRHASFTFSWSAWNSWNTFVFCSSVVPPSVRPRQNSRQH